MDVGWTYNHSFQYCDQITLCQSIQIDFVSYYYYYYFVIRMYALLATQSCLTLCNTMDCSSQAPPSMGFPRKEYWSVLPCLSPGDLPDTGIEPGSPVLQADSLPSEPPGKSIYALILFLNNSFYCYKHCDIYCVIWSLNPSFEVKKI